MQLSQTQLQQVNKLSFKPLTGKQITRKVAAKAASRPLWLPGADAPAHLDGSMPGDFGFDPLLLSQNEDARRWFQQAEVNNSRWAMLGVAGILIPGLLSKIGILNLPAWYDAAKLYPFPFVKIEGNPTPGFVFACQFFFFIAAEGKRIQDWRKPGTQGEPALKGISLFGTEKPQQNARGDPQYPGGIFDPLGFSKGKNLEELQLKEIKNGRLAMLAWLGFNSQHIVTGKDPFDNLFDHLRDPTHLNAATNGVSVPFKTLFQFDNITG